MGSQDTIQITTFNSGGFEVNKGNHETDVRDNKALLKIRDYIRQAFEDRIDFMGIQEAGNKGKLKGARTFEVDGNFDSVVEDAETAILYNRKRWRPLGEGMRLKINAGYDEKTGKDRKRPITACLFERRGNHREVVLVVNAWFPHVGSTEWRHEKATESLISAMQKLDEEVYQGQDRQISAAFFTADFNEYFQYHGHQKDTLPLFIDGQEHKMLRARKPSDKEKTFCNAGKDALHSGKWRDVSRAEDRCEDLGSDHRHGFMDGVYYWIPRNARVEWPQAKAGDYAGSDHLPVECQFVLNV